MPSIDNLFDDASLQHHGEMLAREAIATNKSVSELVEWFVIQYPMLQWQKHLMRQAAWDEYDMLNDWLKR